MALKKCDRAISNCDMYSFLYKLLYRFGKFFNIIIPINFYITIEANFLYIYFGNNIKIY